MTPKTIGIAVIAGAASALLALGPSSGGGIAILLYFLAPLPLMIAGLGWGAAAGIVASGTAALAIGAGITPASGAIFLLATALPSLVMIHFAGLARPADEVGGPAGDLAWFPLGDIVFRAALVVGAAFTVIDLVSGNSSEAAAALARELFAAMQESDPELALPPESQAVFVTVMTRIAPFLQSGMWLVLLTACFYAALAAVRASGLHTRPADDWPLTLRMPREAHVVLFGAIAVSLLGATAAQAGGAVAGALMAAFTLAGYARFHLATRGKPARGLALGLAYMATALIAATFVIFLIAGLLDTRRHMPTSRPGGPPPLNPT